MKTYKICDVDQELEHCHLCDGIVARGDAVRESPGIDEDGVEYTALEHAQCIAEDDRLGISANLNADEIGGCMADLAEIAGWGGEPVSPEYRTFRAEVDARVPAMTVDVRRLVLMERDIAATLARAKAAEAKAAELETRWADLRAKVVKAYDEANGECSRAPLTAGDFAASGEWAAFKTVKDWISDADKAASCEQRGDCQ